MLPVPSHLPPSPTPTPSPAPRLLAYSGFPFPIALTMWHMTFCSTVGFIAVRVLKLVKSHNMSPRDYMQRVFPIGEWLQQQGGATKAGWAAVRDDTQ